MKNRIQNAFEPIRASESLKRKTLASIRTSRRPVAGTIRRHVVLATLLFLAVVSFGGYRVYYTPTDVISIDMDPSVELSINRFERVIGCKSFGTDGEELLGSLSLGHKNYEEAVHTLITSSFLNRENSGVPHVSLTVASNSPQRQQRMMQTLERKYAAIGDMEFECRTGSLENLGDAHRHGMSLGKYSLYLEWSETDDDVTTEEVRGMRMQEMKEHMLEQGCDGSESNQQKRQQGK